MKKVIVTGCAGFIGSTLSERLLKEGHQVIGIDCFTSHYDLKVKESNIRWLLAQEEFTLIKRNILDLNWPKLLANVDYVFHQAAVPGVRKSWGKNFDEYVKNNVVATQIMLDAAINSGIQKFIYASSSSIYGNVEGQTSEEKLPRPVSPYGVTKLSGEQLCHLYSDNYGVPTVALRYFTVYGPRQRPDMAFHKFCKAIMNQEIIEIYGDGKQTRDFTYIDDIVEANLLAMQSDICGIPFNIGGKSRMVLNDVIDLMGRLMNREPIVQYQHVQAGDPLHTWADISRAQELLQYEPKVSIEEGLKRQIEYIKALYQG